MKPEPNVCTKQCQAKQSYHFTVAVTISAAEDLDAPRKNATAKIVALRKVSWTRYQNTCVKGRSTVSGSVAQNHGMEDA